ncbi:MAG: DUF2975 domain-containing protein [Clostridia bacterium]|nr:DUF2975 domain-containing protein [Clostridia bacterium]MBQ2730841.1 DUF2975 domain-containing protein [Clostridia bacterium]
MLKVSKKLSTTLSLALSILFFFACVAGLFLLPSLTELLIELPDHLGDRGNVSDLGRAIIHVCAYVIVLDMMLADVLLFRLLFFVRHSEVFTAHAVSMIRGVSWCCLFLCVPFGILTVYFQLSLIVCVLSVFLGLSLRVCKNAFEEAVAIKEENDLTV